MTLLEFDRGRDFSSVGTLPKSWRFRSKSRGKIKPKISENDKTRSRSKSRGRHLRDYIKNKIVPTKEKYTMGGEKNETLYSNEAFINSQTELEIENFEPVKTSAYNFENFDELKELPKKRDVLPDSRSFPEIRGVSEPRKPSIYSVHEDTQHDSFYSEPTSTEPTCTFLTQGSSDDEDDDNAARSYEVEICEVFDPPDGFKDTNLTRWSSRSSLEIISPTEDER